MTRDRDTNGEGLARRLGVMRGPAALTVAVPATLSSGVLVALVGRAAGVRGVAFAFACNWVAMCWMGIVARLRPPRLAENYFAIRPFERSGRVYELLGVRVIKLVVRRGPLHLFNAHLRLPAEQTSERLATLEHNMREPEAAHLVLFALMLPVAVHAAVRGWWWSAAWVTAFNIMLNAYPVMLQRYNRRWLLDRIAASTMAT